MESSSKLKTIEEFEARIFDLDIDGVNEPIGNGLSFYERSISNCASFICCCPGDRFPLVQKILLKHIFSDSDIRSLFASDLYIFTYRLIHPDFRASMRQIVTNLCKMAPSEKLIKGEALIKRMNDVQKLTDSLAA